MLCRRTNWRGFEPRPTDLAEKIELMGTLRGRVGYAFDHWMIYATGGVAWSLGRYIQTPGVVDETDRVLHLHTGWAPVPERKSRSRRGGRSGWNISTGISDRPTSCSRRARRPPRRTTSTPPAWD